MVLKETSGREKEREEERKGGDEMIEYSRDS